MDRLVDLLNEYERSKGTNLEITNWKWVYWNLSYFWYGNWYSEFLCISKRYGFIQRLVENDKIDLEKLDKKSERKPMYSFEEEWKIWFKLFEVYESLLMLLAIQENPIEFLCSVLK